MKRKDFLVIAIVAVMALVLVGCGGKSKSPASQSSTTPPPQGVTTPPIGNGERWADHDFTTFVPKPDKPLGDVMSLAGDDYYYVGVKFESKADQDAYIAKAKEAGFVEGRGGDEWRGTKNIEAGVYKSVYLNVDFSDTFGPSGAIRISLSKYPAP